MFDIIIKITWFMFNAVLSWFLIYLFSPYNPNKPNAKYITLKNKFAARLLISKRNPWLKYVKVKDRDKLYFPCLIGYICLALTVVFSVIVATLPPMLCTPTTLPYSRRGQFNVSTYNEKIPLSLILILNLIIFICVLGSVFVSLLKKKDEPKKTGSIIFIIFVILLFTFCTVWLFINMIK